MDEYLIVDRNKIDEAVRRTGWPRYVIKSDLQDAEYRNCKLVLFLAKGEWHRIFVSNEYSVNWVIRELDERWRY